MQAVSTQRIIVNYLRSYEGMGCAKLTLNGVNVDLQGSWAKKISTTETFFSQAYANVVQAPPDDKNHYGIIGFGVKPFSQHNQKQTLIHHLFLLLNNRSFFNLNGCYIQKIGDK